MLHENPETVQLCFTCDLYYLRTDSPRAQMWVMSALDIAYPVPSLVPGWWYKLRYSVKECWRDLPGGVRNVASGKSS